MKKSCCYYFAVIILFIAESVFGYSYLTVGDPRNSWWTEQGTIENAEVHVWPKGIYTDFDIYLTFSARNTSYTATDTLEVVLNFELPEGAIIHDMWLWFGNDTLRGRIMDRWTATSIYEGVVKRRRDPSLLQKLDNNRYELKIFPMAGNENRKVRISVMLPTNWNKNKVSSALVTDLLQCSRTPVEKLSVITYTDNTWKNPTIQGISDISFIQRNTPELGLHYFAEIDNDFFSNLLSISFDSPAKNGIFLSKYIEGDEGIYQMALLPGESVSNVSGQKIAVLFDYDISNTNLSSSQVINQTRELLLQNLTPVDSFNLFFSNISIVKGNSWFPADSLTISNVFNNLENPLSSYSNLPTLINAGIDFISSHGNKGKIVLISNSDQYGDYQIANRLLNDIMALMDPIIPFYIADFNTTSSYYYINGRYYMGNEYFFSNLSKFTTGSYQNMLTNGKRFSEIVDNSIKYVSGSIKSFDLYTSLDDGICYGRYKLGSNSDIVYLKDHILQAGKFIGNFPFKVNYSGEFESEIISQEITINEPEILTSDSMLRKIWAGMYIQQMEMQSQTNDIITDIIQKSLNEKVLSRYTALLCIEKSLLETPTPEIKIGSDKIFKVYPNPFTGAVTISINLEGHETENILFAAIYTITGQQVFIPDISNFQNQAEIEFQWDGTDSSGEMVPKGIYIFVLKTDKNVYQVKLIKT